MSRQYTKIEIPDELFIHRSMIEEISNEQIQQTPVVKLEWNKGIFLYLENAEYPQKGLTSPETMWGINICKRNLIEPFRLLRKWYFWPSFFVMLFANKTKLIGLLIRTYNEISWRAVKPFVLKSEYMTPIAQEFEWAIYSFLRNIGIDTTESERFSQIFSSMVEYDTAYRYRLEDIFTETTKAQLVDNPIKEISRLFKIYKEREVGSSYMHDKFRFIVWPIRILLLLNGKIRKAFKTAILEIDIRKLQLDEGERYWCLLRDDYNYLGKTWIERENILKSEGKKKPNLIMRKQ